MITIGGPSWRLKNTNLHPASLHQTGRDLNLSFPNRKKDYHSDKSFNGIFHTLLVVSVRFLVDPRRWNWSFKSCRECKGSSPRLQSVSLGSWNNKIKKNTTTPSASGV